MDRRRGRRAAVRVPARGPGVGRDVEGLPGPPVRGRRLAWPRLLPTRLRPFHAATASGALAARLHAPAGARRPAHAARNPAGRHDGRPALAVRPQRRRVDRVDPRGELSDAGRRTRRDGAASRRRAGRHRQHRARAGRVPRRRPARAARTASRRRRLGLPRLERRVVVSRLPIVRHPRPAARHRLSGPSRSRGTTTSTARWRTSTASPTWYPGRAC